MEGLQREYWNDLAGPRWVASQPQLDDTLAPYADALRPALAGLGEGACIVDVGCGCGATTLMAHRCAPRADVLGLDVSEPMLELARERAARLNTERIRFVLHDATSEPLPEGSVDRIISRFGVMFFADPVAAFTNMRRWLKPEGYMALVVWGPRDENPWTSRTLAILAEHVDVPAPDPEAPGPFALGSAEKRARLFEQAGLRIESETSLNHPMRVRGDVDEVVRFYTERGPAALALQNASAQAREAATEALGEFVRSTHDGRGASVPGKALLLKLTPDPNAPEPEPDPDPESAGEDGAGAQSASAEESSGAQPEEPRE